MEQELTLVMSFKNQDNKETTVTLKHIKSDLTEKDISDAMDIIVTSNLFLSSGGDLVSKSKAQLIDKTIQEFNM